MTLADQIVVMRDGQIVQQGAAGHLRPALQYLRRPLYRLPADESPARSARRARRSAGVACGALWFPLAERWHQAVAQQGDAR